MMYTITRVWILLTILSIACLVMLAGCSSMPTATSAGGSGTGYGASADLLPSKPATPPAAPTPPTAQLALLLRATAADQTSFTLAITKVELQYLDTKSKEKWYTLADENALKSALPALPFTANTTGAICLLSNNSVPLRDYSAVRLSFDAKGTTFTNKTVVSSLVLENSTLSLGTWALDTKVPNVITISVDGAKVPLPAANAKDTTVKVPTAAVTLAKGPAQGSIGGKLAPAVANTKVEAFWGESKVAMASVVAKIDDGTFTLSNLPPGPYRLVITAAGYHPTTALKPTMVETTTTDLGTIALSADATK